MSKSLEIGIVGLPNVGKSTLYNALTKNNALAANYPFATIEPNIGIVAVPDERLKKLADLYNSEKIVSATIKFIDIAGLVKGAASGEGLGNRFLSHIRQCEIICHVVRDFSSGDVSRIHNAAGPKEDIEIINTELVLADLETVNKRLAVTEKQAKSDPKLKPIYDNLLIARDHLDSGTPLIQSTDLNFEDLRDLNLLTAKSVIYIFNIDEQALKNKDKLAELKEMVRPSPVIFVNAQIESELSSLPDEEASELLKSYGQDESSLRQLIRMSYQTLGLQSFLTAGPKEVRAWTIAIGTNAQQAAGVIHTDFARGFIAAEVVSYQDLIDCGSLVKAKQLGKVRTEGKQYIMQPDDVVEFRFNV